VAIGNALLLEGRKMSHQSFWAVFGQICAALGVNMQYAVPFRNHNASNVTGVENRGQISRF